MPSNRRNYLANETYHLAQQPPRSCNGKLTCVIQLVIKEGKNTFYNGSYSYSLLTLTNLTLSIARGDYKFKVQSGYWLLDVTGYTAITTD